MPPPPCTFVYLPGAGGGEADLAVLRRSLGDAFRFETADYPGWRRYIDDRFTAETLLEELTTKISTSMPQGPILIVGVSLGGHFGYAAALQLEAMGRKIGGICAIDTFMIDSSGPSEGWQTRALGQALELVREGRIGKLMRFARSRFWRALFRLSGSRLTGIIRSSAVSGRLPWILAWDPIAEEELSMRLLLRKVAPWVPSLDCDPAPLNVPAVLLRTPLTATDDATWKRRCPSMKIYEIPGQHLALFEPENISSLSNAFTTATRERCQSRS